MNIRILMRGALLLALAAAAVAPLSAQTFPTNDRVIRNMWTQGMGTSSQVYRLAQSLIDSIGPRVTGTAGHDAAVEWLLEQYATWGVSARKEQYGTWRGWRRSHTRLELLAPRYRELDGTMLAYSPGTNGPIEGPIVVLPELPDSAAYDRWIEELSGELVLYSAPEPTCRPDYNWNLLARPETTGRVFAQQDSTVLAWSRRVRAAGRNFAMRLARSDAGAVLTSYWSGGFGVDKIHDTWLWTGRVLDFATVRAPVLDVSCEDFGLLHRLAQNQQGPRVRLDAEAELLAERPVFNVIAEMRGRELPDEYVVLSAHLDSFDSASGATDNGTGTLMMLEAMRILRATYPNPRRTILVGHWAGEEQGVIGSAAFAADHPEVSAGLQIGFNQDNGTWRIEAIRMQDFNRAIPQVQRWLDQIPNEIADTVKFTSPDAAGGSDESSFHCAGAPFVRLQSNYPDYRQYTWHTNLDTFDKIVFDDLRNNATLAAMLAYLASEDPERLSRERDPLPPDPQGRVPARAACSQPRRTSTGLTP